MGPRRAPTPLEDSSAHLLTDRPWYLRARLVLVLVAWGLLLFGGITLHVLCDVFQSAGPHFPFIPCVFSAMLFNAVAAFIGAYVGSITVEGFRLYQPFVGGQSFVVMQAFGYGSVALAESLVCVYIQMLNPGEHDRRPETTYGVLSVLGAFPFLGNMALLTSLMFFSSSPATPTHAASTLHHDETERRVRFSPSNPASHGGAVSSLMHRWSKSPQREMCLVISFCAVIVLFSIICTVIPRAGKVCLVLYLSLQGINGLLIHVAIGWRCTPGYRLFMPRLPSWKRTISQLVLWVLLVASMYWAMGMALSASVPKATSLIALCIGGVSVTTALLIFVRTAFERQTSIDASPSGLSSSKSMLAQYGPTTITFACLLHGCLVWGLEWHRLTQKNAEEGFRVAQTMTAIFMLGFPPATHLLGNLVHGESFFVWQPFRGCLPFIALQGLGWTSFGASFIALAVHLTETNEVGNGNRPHSALVLAALLAFSQAMIHSSLVIFAPSDEDDGLLRRQFPSAIPKVANRVKRLLSPSKRPLSLASAVANGEMMVAVLLMTMVMTIRVVCDVAVLQWRWGRDGDDQSLLQHAAAAPLDESTVHLMAFLSTWLGVATVPLAHISGRDKGIAVFRPFGGSGAYVALQAIGWTIYSAALLMTTLVTVVHGAAALKRGRWAPDLWVGVIGGFDQQCLLSLPPCWFIVDAMLWLLPLSLIIVSVAVETKQNWVTSSLEEDAWEAESELLALISKCVTREDDQIRAVELVHALTQSQSKHHMPWSSYTMMASKHPHRGSRTTNPTEAEEMRRRATMKEQQGTATLIICMTCVGTAVLFIVGALWIGREPRILSAGFAFAGFVLTTISCFATHYVYGSLVHGTYSSYAFFMPFTGGVAFVALQGVGWAFYTAATVLVLQTFLLSGAAISTYLIAAVFSVSAQALILGSIPRFVHRQHHNQRSSLERNAEAILAGLLFVASFSYAQAYRAWDDSITSNSRDSIGSVLTPLVVSCVSSFFAVPLTVAALHRSIRNPTPPLVTTHAETHADYSISDSMSAAESQLSTLALRLAQLLGMVTTLLLVLLPAALAFLAHFFVHPASYLGVETISNVWLNFTATIGLMTLASVVLDVLSSPKSTSVVTRMKAAGATFVIFSVPTYVVAGPLSLPLLLDSSIGARVFTVHALVLVLLGDVAVVRFLCSIAEVCALAYNLTRHIENGSSYYLVRGGNGELVGLVADIVLPVFMLWYHRRFAGAPERFGQLTSGTFSKWLQKLGFFDSISSYFRLTVRVDALRAATVPPSSAPSHCWERGPVLFSYHPHGVFPGTTLLLQHTKVWQDAVRIPRSHQHGHHQKLSVHAAGVVFRVPFLRDFGMALGGRVVTRAAIHTSLEQGNSVMIVTGGQAEMLHSRPSNKEMHLVTHHHGFLKMAVQHQVPVVPLVCFAEHNVMDNVHVPWLQKKMLKLIGFPFPTVPHGRWFLPLPNRTPLTVVVGRPVNPPDGLCADDRVGIQQFADAYFAEVKRIFYAHRVACGYPEMELVLHGRGH